MRQHHKKSGSSQKTRGFSLVEMMIAMTVGLFLISSMIAVFVANKRTGEVNNAMANIQEGARFALNSIARDARVSGYQGCIDVNRGDIEIQSNASPVLPGGLRDTSAHASVVDADGDLVPVSPVGFTPSNLFPPVPGTHALMLQFGDQRVATVTGPMMNAGTTIPNPTLPIQMDRTMAEMGLQVGDLAIIANCDVGDLFTVTAGSAGSTLNHAANGNANGNVAASLSMAYGLEDTIPQTRIMELNTNIYYVGDTGVTNNNGDTITALYRQSWPFTTANPPTELIQGVEDLRVAFGIRGAGNALRYISPDATTGFNPEDIEALHVGVLMNSFDRISQTNDTNTYELAGQSVFSETKHPSETSVHKGDLRFRLAFNTTIKIRNRRQISE